jgi:hypothetical protein
MVAAMAAKSILEYSHVRRRAPISTDDSTATKMVAAKVAFGVLIHHLAAFDRQIMTFQSCLLRGFLNFMESRLVIALTVWAVADNRLESCPRDFRGIHRRDPRQDSGFRIDLVDLPIAFLLWDLADQKASSGIFR